MNTNRRRFLFLLPVIIIPAVFGIVFLETNTIEIRHCLIEDDRLGGVLDGVRIALVSDLHSREMGPRERLLVDTVRNDKPDMLMLAGDYASKEGNYAPVLEIMKSARCPLGVYAVMGNAEYAHAGRSCILCHEPGSDRKRENGAGFVLRNSVRILERNGAKLCIIGLDDPVTRKRNGRCFLDLREIVAGLDPGMPKILLAHSPDIFEEAARLGIDLVLCGHTHGGQLFFVPMIPGITRTEPALKYPTGFYRRDRTIMYVTRGMGTNVLPIRLGVRPEITMIRFSRTPAGAPVKAGEERREARLAGVRNGDYSAATAPGREKSGSPSDKVIVLKNFESEADLRDLDWECGKMFEIFPERGGPGEKSLRAVLPPGPRATIRLHPGPADWSKHGFLKMEIFSLCAASMRYCLRIDDRSNPGYSDRYERCGRIDPGMNRIAVPVESILTNGNGGRLDLKRIRQVILSFPDDTAKEVHISRLRLE